MADEPDTGTTPVTPQAEPQGKTFTQAELEQKIGERLARERQKYEGYDDLKAKAAELDEIKAANASEIEKAQGKATKAEQRAADAEAKLLRYEVAQEKNVPGRLVPLLTASSKEELESQADLILENAKPADPDFDGGPRDPAPEPKTPEQEHNDVVTALFGGSPNQ